jgi:hypothetical protein
MGSTVFEQLLPLSIELVGGVAVAASGGVIDYGGLLVLPENAAVLVSESFAGYAAATYTFDGVNRVTGRAMGATDAINRSERLEGRQRGGIPAFPVATGYQASVFTLPEDGAHNRAFSAEIRVRERFMYSK